MINEEENIAIKSKLGKLNNIPQLHSPFEYSQQL